ncbi:MAG TPA: hypothetical protein VGP82_18720 [Ktedonobacterales bacterium]|jgi:hypothetical protein|nr:hypothetical protein [Ktedonobacterales bacterium]
MTRFTLTGTLKYSDEIRTVGWHDGRLFGNAELCAAVERNAKWFDGRLIGICGYWYTSTAEGHLASPHSARQIMLEFFERRTVKQEGVLPLLPGPPPGAIA